MKLALTYPIAYSLARSIYLSLSIWHAQNEIINAIDKNIPEKIVEHINLVDVSKLEKKYDEYYVVKGLLSRNVCRNGPIELVKLVLKKGAYVDLDGILYDFRKDKVIDNSRIETVKFLINNSPNNVIQENRRALHYACGYGNLEIAELLIDKGACVNGYDYEGRRPLYYACQYNDLRIVDFLVKKGANINILSRDGKLALELIIWKSYSPWDGKKTEYSEERALNDFEMVKLLIENNAKVNSINSYGHTLLYDAFYTNNPKMVIYLIECGADINKANEDGNTPLHAAVDYGTLKEVKFLLKKGACVNARNGRRETPLHKVYADTHVEGARLLLSAGAHIDDADCNGNTVLHKSVRAKNVQMVKFLLDNGADLNKLNESGFENIIETYLYFRCWTRAENNDSALKDDFDCSINSKEISPFTLAYSIKNRKIKQPMLEAMEAVNEAKTKRKANALGTVVINQSGKSITDICKTTTVDTRSVHLPYNNLIVSARSSGAVAFLNYVQNNK